jgi:hypothetical protein
VSIKNMVKKSFAFATLISGLCMLPSYAQVPTAAQDTAAAQAQFAQATQAAAAVTSTMPAAQGMMTPAQVTAAMTTMQAQLAAGQPLTPPPGVTATMQSNFVPMTATPAVSAVVNGAPVTSAVGAAVAGAVAVGTLTGILGSPQLQGAPQTVAAPLPTGFDPSSFIPFQTSEQTSTVQTADGPVQVDATVINGTGYYNPTAPPGQSVVNGLPQTSLDSFVYSAGGLAELIYGDEGVDSIPPYFEFDQTHRINLGILGARAQGLTTGHSSMLPNAWGGDEFVKTEPFTMSGSGVDIGANGQLVNAANGQPTNGFNVGVNIGGLNITGNPVTGINVGGLNVGGVPAGGLNINGGGVNGNVGGLNFGTGF